MPESLGYRAKIGVRVPSTNTSVEPELAGMRPVGVANRSGRNRKTWSVPYFPATFLKIAAASPTTFPRHATC